MIDEERPDAAGGEADEAAADAAEQEAAAGAGEAGAEQEAAAAGAGEAGAEQEAAAEAQASTEGAEAPVPEEQAPAASEGAAPGEDEAPSAPAGALGGQPEVTERPRDRRGRRRDEADEAPPAEAIPGAHLEPDLVLEETQPEAEPEFAEYAEPEVAPEPAADAPAPAEAPPEEAVEQPAPAAPSPRDLAADARYRATGKRKTSVARVIVRPGDGAYTVNGRTLEDYFPRPALQKAARQPLESAGYETRMDVVAKIHGGGVSAQAGALRHGVARALVEADPHLRGELKRRGFLTRDARAKERKKAGLKKARKRPQFSKR